MLRNEAASKSLKRPVYFATTNRGKYEEVAALATECRVALRRLDMKPPEIQSESLGEIARTSALQLIGGGNPSPIIVEDAGLFIEALNGFPGPFSSYTYAKLGTEGILKLLKGRRDRGAYFLSVIAYADGETPPILFEGRADGLITNRSRGTFGFGFDPIFQPLDTKKTFAEMTTAEKNQYSHRAQAFRKFTHLYLSK
jgi:XTP/dITP diphosphohydrolase